MHAVRLGSRSQVNTTDLDCGPWTQLHQRHLLGRISKKLYWSNLTVMEGSMKEEPCQRLPSAYQPAGTYQSDVSRHGDR